MFINYSKYYFKFKIVILHYKKGYRMINLEFKNRFYLLSMTFLLLMGCGSQGSSSAKENEAVTRSPANTFKELTAQEQETLDLLSTNQQALLEAINKERSQKQICGELGAFGPVQPLRWNSSLYASALEHATDLAVSNTFSHDGSGTASDITGDGRPSKFYERILANGYSNFHKVGENIAGGQQELTQVMHDWMASPKHCQNIMNSSYTEVGVAIMINNNSDYQVYWAQNFGSKRS